MCPLLCPSCSSRQEVDWADAGGAAVLRDEAPGRAGGDGQGQEAEGGQGHPLLGSGCVGPIHNNRRRAFSATAGKAAVFVVTCDRSKCPSTPHTVASMAVNGYSLSAVNFFHLSRNSLLKVLCTFAPYPTRSVWWVWHGGGRAPLVQTQCLSALWHGHLHGAAGAAQHGDRVSKMRWICWRRVSHFQMEKIPSKHTSYKVPVYPGFVW